MFEQAQAFLDESEALLALVEPLDEASLSFVTGFKRWTIEDVIGHLHIWNHAGHLSLTDEAAFHAFFAEVQGFMRSGAMKDFERQWLGDLKGRRLVAAWADGFRALAAAYGAADPSTRVVWAGPSMSVRSSVTARLMETWAHGQEVYDRLGVERVEHDRIRNIVVLGANTYGWTFKVHAEEAPDPMPCLVLDAPSGAVWTFGEESATERIEGKAVEFCQVVTQTRNVADTALVVTGDNARRWMAIAQCFAGPPETPPAPGTRGPHKG